MSRPTRHLADSRDDVVDQEWLHQREHGTGHRQHQGQRQGTLVVGEHAEQHPERWTRCGNHGGRGGFLADSHNRQVYVPVIPANPPVRAVVAGDRGPALLE